MIRVLTCIFIVVSFQRFSALVYCLALEMQDLVKRSVASP
jgi:hypothetical protein